MKTDRGKMTTERTVWCAECNNWEQEQLPHAEMVVFVRQKGWRKRHGFWLCNSCLAKKEHAK